MAHLSCRLARSMMSEFFPLFLPDPHANRQEYSRMQLATLAVQVLSHRVRTERQAAAQSDRVHDRTLGFALLAFNHTSGSVPGTV